MFEQIPESTGIGSLTSHKSFPNRLRASELSIQQIYACHDVHRLLLLTSDWWSIYLAVQSHKFKQKINQVMTSDIVPTLSVSIGTYSLPSTGFLFICYS
eukprot:c20814_g1_i2 orf=55-351(-)